MKYLFFVLGYFAVIAGGNAQNALIIPPSISGTSFQLNVQNGTKVFYTGTSTPTYGINGPILAPTLIVNKGDSITLAVHNGLTVPTTMHWHGLHVAAYNDGGPGQIIGINATWSPSFVLRNNAGTYWYHPHGAGQTDPQVSKGLAGMIIIHDSAEMQLNLPRTYGVDDIPLIVQTKAFDVLQQIAISTEMDTAIFVNGTLHPTFQAPAQVIRFRLLNGSSMRSYNFGFSNNQSFYQIATDGGLKDTPVLLNRLRLSPGERAEILVDFQGMNGQNVDLISYASEMMNGIYGAAMVGMQEDTIDGYSQNFLNGADFTILNINIIPINASPVTSIPSSLTPYTPYNKDSSTVTRYIVFDTLRKLPLDRPNLADGPFGINNKSFSMDTINISTTINSQEVWVLVNKTLVAHPFHIHDVQFNVIEQSGSSPSTSQVGWKDVVLVLPQDSVKFVTRFETFANATVPYMYHCHLLHHEDDGMMGQFIVVDNTNTSIQPISNNTFDIFPNPANQQLKVIAGESVGSGTISLIDVSGRTVLTKNIANNSYPIQIDVASITNGLYYLVNSDPQQKHAAKVIIQH
ncbi:MAG: multicopper oxidase domain-containing protein [Bacteroidetes bacterium]|nr:multicopper oxidase domain-containing protein [Bacteroidota bacterium]